jgi:hypothetical protein
MVGVMAGQDGIQTRLRAVSCAVLLAGLSIVVAASFMSWIRTGTRRRSSFELVAVVRRLGVIDNPVVAGAARGWVLIPLLAATALLLTALGRPRLAAVLALCVAGSAIALAQAVNSAPVRAEGGVGAGLVGAMMTIAGAAGVLFFHRGRTDRGDTDE